MTLELHHRPFERRSKDKGFGICGKLPPWRNPTRWGIRQGIAQRGLNVRVPRLYPLVVNEKHAIKIPRRVMLGHCGASGEPCSNVKETAIWGSGPTGHDNPRHQSQINL